MTRSKKSIIILAAFVVAAPGVFIWQGFRASEPLYEGKTLSEWVVLLDSHTDHKAQNEAAEKALQAMGKKALPGLIRILHKRADPPLVAKVKALAIRFHLLRPPELQLAEFQYRAARACCVLGGWSDVDIRAAIPDLAYSLTNNVSRTFEPFAWALVYSGPEGLSVITNVMATDSSPQVREAAAHSLWISRKIRTPEIAGALVSATQDSDANVRVVALLTLQSFAEEKDLANIIAPGVLHCLQDTNAQVRRWTVELLGRFSSFPEVGAALTNMLNDPDPTVRSQAERLFQRKAGGVEQ
jgi:HEAT repeat protein